MQTMLTMFNVHIKFLSVLLMLPLYTTTDGIWSDRHLATAARQPLTGIRVKMDEDEDISTWVKAR